MAVDVDEAMGDATVQTPVDVGPAVTVTDPDGDSLTYSLVNPWADERFTVDKTVDGFQIRTKAGASFGYEPLARLGIPHIDTAVRVEDGHHYELMLLDINLIDVAEPPQAPTAPLVRASARSLTGLDVSWTAPSNAGRPPIEGYDLRYRPGTSGAWSDGPQNVTGTSPSPSPSITGLVEDTQYQVQVRAGNADGEGPWSSAGSGRTNGSGPTLSIADVTVEEGSSLAFTVTLFPAAESAIAVTYAASDGTATSGVDYTSPPANATLNFAAGETSKTITIATVNDAVPEGVPAINVVSIVDDIVPEAPAESLTVTLTAVTLSNPSSPVPVLTKATATGVIKDNDFQSLLAIFDYMTMEGSNLEFTVRLGPPSVGQVTVQYATSDGSATSDAAHPDGADYTAPAPDATLTFDPGETTKTIVIPTGDDKVPEANEQFTVTLSNPSSNATLGRSTATGQILTDGDAIPELSISGSTSTEGSNVEFTVRLDPAAESEVTVQYATQDIEATAGADYVAPPANATLTFAPGETERTVAIATVDDDTALEGYEYFAVTLSNPSSYAVLGAPSTAKGGIKDDDFQSDLSIDDVWATEGTDLEFTVRLSPAQETDVTVEYAVQAYSATSGTDYVEPPANATLTFAAGETVKAIAISTIDDTAIEQLEELLVVRLSNANPSENVVYRDSRGSGRIIDNDKSVPTLGISTGQQGGEGSDLEFVVVLGGTCQRL